MAIEIRARDFARAIEQRLRADTEIVRAAALDTVLWGQRRVVARTNAEDLVDLGAYKLGWSTRRIRDGAELGNSVPYAPVLEYGRRPNRPGPPLQPIIEWVHRKLRGEIRGQYRAAKALSLGLASGVQGSVSFKRAAMRHTREQFGTERNALAAGVLFVAMNIRDAIHFRGTKPRRVLRHVYVDMKVRFPRIAKARLRAAGRGQ